MSNRGWYFNGDCGTKKNFAGSKPVFKRFEDMNIEELDDLMLHLKGTPAFISSYVCAKDEYERRATAETVCSATTKVKLEE